MTKQVRKKEAQPPAIVATGPLVRQIGALTIGEGEEVTTDELMDLIIDERDDIASTRELVLRTGPVDQITLELLAELSADAKEARNALLRAAQVQQDLLDQAVVELLRRGVQPVRVAELLGLTRGAVTHRYGSQRSAGRGIR